MMMMMDNEKLDVDWLNVLCNLIVAEGINPND